MRSTLTLLFVLVLSAPSAWAEDQTWVELDGVVYGAKPDDRGPIGGGAGYRGILSGGAHEPENLDGLLAALKKAKPGQVVFLREGLEIDLTERVYTEGLVLELPGGVTLAGDRGRDGSKGALLFSDAFQTRPLIRVLGPGARVTGLRVRGPDPKRRMAHHRRSFHGPDAKGRSYYYKFPVSDGIATRHGRLEVDNCELSGWSHAAIYLRAGEGHRVHHNRIHRNQYNGLGYGVCHDRAVSLIEQNLFDANRHSIAGTGRPGSGYEARNNVELGVSLSHCFDMHGGRDRKDGTNTAGDWMKIHHNTFRARRQAIVIRGVPREGATVSKNWFFHDDVKQAVRRVGKTEIHDNAFSLTRPRVRGKKRGGWF